MQLSLRSPLTYASSGFSSYQRLTFVWVYLLNLFSQGTFKRFLTASGVTVLERNITWQSHADVDVYRSQSESHRVLGICGGEQLASDKWVL